jgi:Rrf2 family protein
VHHISAKAEYACLAALELATQFQAGQPVRAGAIAQTHGIPLHFLVQILSQLRNAGLVTSTRGAAGGYQLPRDPQEVTLGEVLAAVAGPASSPKNSTNSSHPFAQVLSDTWQEVAQAKQRILDATTLADLVEQAQSETADMYYI